MALFTYTLPGSTFGGDSVMYVDPDCTVRATLTQLNGAPIPGGEVFVGQDGASFQSASNPLYTPDSTGATTQLAPQLNYAASPAVTGSRGSATAAVIENLIQALITAGVPITDQTTA